MSGGPLRRALLRLRGGAAKPPEVTVRADYYSPVPDMNALPEEVWSRRSPMPGIRLDLEAQLAMARGELAPYLAEFSAPESGDSGFFMRNRYYEHGDAELAYAMVRHLAPTRILELGSGFSTRVLAMAAERNAGEGHRPRLLSCNPFPPAALEADPPPGLSEHRRVRAQDIPDEEFAALGRDDVLFVDTSHTVKLGGDVNRVVLEVLPNLAPGVVVHFHDIWLPYEYHRTLVEEMGMFWAEQYLLQAYLAENPHWEILFATQALAHDRDAELQGVLPTYSGDNYPSAFWLRRLT